MNEFDDICTPDDVYELASKATGLSEIDSDSWREGLGILLDELNTVPAFTPEGRTMILKDAVQNLGRRLQVHDYILAHPEVLDTSVDRPLIVLGMPRTGTTVISYLLDQDPARRSLLHWECIHPVPPAATATLRTDPRCVALIEERTKLLETLKQNNIYMPHWEDADGPTEDMFIHTQDFKALSWDSYLATPRYAQWLCAEADMTSTYEYQKRFLQVLQSRAPGAWSLKMPSHSVHIEALLSVFPDARLIWAHRDPYKATGSLANLFRYPKGMTLDPASVDPTALGQNAKAQMRCHVENPLRARERIGDHRFFDMYYHEMMRDPLDVMRRIYEWAGDSLTDDVEAAMARWLDTHPQNLLGVGKYNLDEYGLDVDALRPVFAEYLSAFDIELEGDA